MTTAAVSASAPNAALRRVVVGATVGAALLNLVINAAVALLQVRGQHHIPLWGISVAHPSVITDSLGILISLPLLTCVICTTALRRDRQLPQLEPAALGRLSALTAIGVGRRAVRMAAITFIAIGPPIVLGLLFVTRSGMTRMDFVVYHVALTVVLGVIVTPIVALLAMTDHRHSIPGGGV
jgi:hypothetical protein